VRVHCQGQVQEAHKGLHVCGRLGSRWEDDKHVGISLGHDLQGFRYVTMLCRHPQPPAAALPFQLMSPGVVLVPVQDAGWCHGRQPLCVTRCAGLCDWSGLGPQRLRLPGPSRAAGGCPAEWNGLGALLPGRQPQVGGGAKGTSEGRGWRGCSYMVWRPGYTTIMQIDGGQSSPAAGYQQAVPCHMW
jgi:hypothetical protein